MTVKTETDAPPPAPSEARRDERSLLLVMCVGEFVRQNS